MAEAGGDFSEVWQKVAGGAKGGEERGWAERRPREDC